MICAGVATLAFGSIAYLLEPRWAQAEVEADVPPLPITVAGAVFNIPPTAIRIPLQRRAGPQERLDLVYDWPDLSPGDARAGNLGRDTEDGVAGGKLFITIEPPQGALPALDRLRTIYPRYAQGPSPFEAGLVMMAFRDGSPYQGEDVIYDAAAPERFLARCERAGSDTTQATCLYERSIGEATLIFRFPREWIGDWRAIAEGIDILIERWRPPPA